MIEERNFWVFFVFHELNIERGNDILYNTQALTASFGKKSTGNRIRFWRGRKILRWFGYSKGDTSGGFTCDSSLKRREVFKLCKVMRLCDQESVVKSFDVILDEEDLWITTEEESVDSLPDLIEPSDL